MAAQKNQLATIEPSGLAADSGLFSDARIALIRNTIAKDAPEDVFRAMIDIARVRNLDPLTKQIQCVKFGGVWQFITTIDGHRAIAEQTGQYAGNDAPIFTWPDPSRKTSAGKRIPESATVTVYKMLAGQRMPFSATVFWEEYDGGRNNWSSMPCTMLAKVAESHALRKAFPAVLSGTYTGDEMDQAGYVEVAGAVAHRGTGEIAERTVPPQSPQNRPQRTERPAPRVEVVQAGGEDTDDATTAMRNRLHRYAPHESLHEWAVSLKYASLKDVPMPHLVELANKISKPAGRELWLQQYPGIPTDTPGDEFEAMPEEDDDPLAAQADAAQQSLVDYPELHADPEAVAARYRQ